MPCLEVDRARGPGQENWPGQLVWKGALNLGKLTRSAGLENGPVEKNHKSSCASLTGGQWTKKKQLVHKSSCASLTGGQCPRPCLTWSPCPKSLPDQKCPCLESCPEPKKTLLNQSSGLESGPEPKKTFLNQSPGLESGLVQKAFKFFRAKAS